MRAFRFCGTGNKRAESENPHPCKNRKDGARALVPRATLTITPEFWTASPSQGLGIKSGCPTRQTDSLLHRSGCLSAEHRVDRRLGAFLTVPTRHADRANDLAVDHDRKRARLWEVVHEGRRQILAVPDHLVGLRGGAPPT